MRKKKKSEGNGFNVWRSYSDMMAGVLLLFVLIMCVTLFQAQKSYNESLQERDEKIAMQEQYTQELLDKQNAIDEKNETLQNQDEQLKTQDEKLAEQQKQLEALAAKLKEQESTLNAQQTALDEKTAQLKDQQAQIDQIIGVKADVIEALKNEFSKNNINVDIDAQTGALTLEASVMFDYDQAELPDSGKQALEQILPIYCKVLLQDDYMKFAMNSAIGSMDEDIDASKEGKDILIGFNPRFLMDALRVIDEDEITMYMINPKAPCFIRDQEETYIYLILPVNFNV